MNTSTRIQPALRRVFFADLFLVCLLFMYSHTVALAAKPANLQIPDSVEVKKDIIYSKTPEKDLKLDLYLPKEGVGPFPAVVYIHGGGWKQGNRRAFMRQAAYMAEKGYVGVCIAYRFSHEAKFPAQIHDCKAAVRWVRAHAKEYRINPKRIGVAGGSAGGHLASLLGTTSGLAVFEGEGGYSEYASAVNAVAAFNPALDLTDILRKRKNNKDNGPPMLDLIGVPYTEHPELYEQASPICHVSEKSVPFLFLHGTEDATVPYEESVRMAEQLKKAGVQAEIFTAKGAGHAFFNSAPWYRPALKAMESFFEKHLKTPVGSSDGVGL